MDLHALRHSAAHILASAVQELYPGTKLAIGPPIEDGFYYDFDRREPFAPEDLAKIEERMRQIIQGKHPFVHEEWPKDRARKFFTEHGETYKLELIDGIPEEQVSIYKHHTFTDLCEGPHVERTDRVPAVKLLSIAGAYWHGDEHLPMLQRIYGTAWPTQAELDAYLKRLDEAKARDHRKLGADLGLFSFEEIAGPGVVFYHPKGALLRRLVEEFVTQEHLQRGYQLVGTPHLFRADLWKQSGHLDYYRDYMFMLNAEGIDYGVKPMNCPGHILIYRARTRSYRDLPLRFFELGTVYRFEKSGVLHGLLRVRGFTQDDAHIFCLEEQLVTEIGGILDFCWAVLKAFGFTDFQVELSTKPAKAIGQAQDWERAEGALTTALKQRAIAFDVHVGEGAFYGPKIDVKIKDSLGRAWQCSTIQCDFALPERFGLAYAGADGKEHRPIMIHRALLGSVERFLGTLIEHYAGAFPLWLAPVQAAVIPIADAQRDYAHRVATRLRQAGLRVEVDDRNEKMQYKIREAQLQKIPYMLVVGGREAAAESVAVRTRAGGDEGTMAVEALVARLQAESQRPS